VVREVETVQTFLTAVEVDRLVADYRADVGVLELANRYGIHRATVAAHLRRRDVLRRSTGLDVNERAEAVRLYRAGQSLRAIGQRLGVDRKTVRAVVISAGVAIRSKRRTEM
jgi:DNA-binding CsgD family transcriptional regulator